MSFRRFAPLGLLPLIAAAPAPQAEPGRLPSGVVPIHYDMRIDADAQALGFKGQETITVSVARPTRTIVLNAAELTIGGVRLDGGVAPTSVKTDETAQTLTIQFAKPVAAGQHKIAIGWSGKINESAAGLFAVDYTDKRGPQRMLVTQFEASDGRRFAPMWDEPARKATFTISAYVPKGQIGFSNMPVATTAKQADGRTLVSFQPSPKMSSYLLFLGMGDVERKTAMAGKTEIGIITRRGAVDQGDYALASAQRILAYYNDYFGVPYPLPKMDMIAAPGSSQFFSAMENWGAILYFDRAVLVDPKVSTETDRQNVFGTVAHEMAHQWFGDLVTMRWWDDLWLNEGFASWMAGKVSGDLNPSWNVDAQDVASAKQGAISLDSRIGTHPIVQRISSVDQVNQAFDAITYQKGQAVIRMLEGAVGPEAFRAGVRGYMAQHKYSNTATDDLWQSISIAAKTPVKPFMDSFTLQAGVPLIKVGEPGCTAGTTRIALTQGRFATDKATDVPQSWLVPVAIRSGAAKAMLNVSAANPGNPVLAGCPASELVVNPGQYGYYRTLYSDRHFAQLTQGFGALPLVDQVGVLGDTAALGNAGYAPVDRMFALIDAVPADADPLVWRNVAGRLAEFDRTLADDPAQPAFRAKAIRLLDPQFARLGFQAKKGEAPADSQLRESLIGVLGGMGDPAVLEGVRKLVAGGLDSIPAAVRDPVIAVYARKATPEQWEALHKAAIAEKNPLAQRGLYTRLGQVDDEALANRTLAIVLTEEASVPNRATLASSVASAHSEMAFDWAVANKAAVEALVEASARQQFIPRLAARGTGAAFADKVEAYVKRTIPPAEQRAATSIIANIRYSAQVKDRTKGAVAAWAVKG